MAERMALIRDPNLLEMVHRLFGEIAVDAFLAISDYGDAEMVQDHIRRERFERVEEELSWDARSILIEFTNGRRLVFSNSEWATIALLTSETETYVWEETSDATT